MKPEAKHTIIVKDEKGKKYSCSLREPGFEELCMSSMAMWVDDDISPAKGGRFIIDTCWVDGDKEIKENPYLLFAASLRASELIIIFDSELKKN